MLGSARTFGAHRRRHRYLRAAALAAAVALAIGACSSNSDEGSGAAGSSTAGSGTSAAASVTGLLPIGNAELQSIVESTAKELMLPGVVVLLRTPSGDQTVTYGTTERGGGAPVTLDDHVRVGSNTKTWTGTVILQQVQEGKIALTDPVSKYRPDVPGGDGITIEQLLNMRSGLFNYSETLELNEALDQDPQRTWTPDQLLALAFTHPPYFPPGQGYHYSNTNFVLLGLIAEQLDGKPLQEVFQDRLFGPLGLKNTVFPDSNALPTPYSRGYMYGTNVQTMTDPALPAEMQAEAKAGTLAPNDVTDGNPSWAWSAGSGIATANDLATWVEALADGKALDAEMQAVRMASFQPTDPTKPGGPEYGLAMAKMGPLYGHTGELPGYNSFMGSDPESGVTLVVWANLAPAANGQDPASGIAKTIVDAMFPPAAAPASIPAPAPTS
ncbi:D-alanyl-D-alanine carboxypeptidase [Rhodococcus tukisamuensis]|uniref:D-alanyl-D-alanine carboxypeptidase n=2 Tax=Rhodococcus tukisamuensis TaxID=168276 RepID=A0A1G6QUJ5_9NOCA|nr:D-alanyl-D-alanine carboxypeptidase [Rhodococcus tukisamuensis]